MVTLIVVIAMFGALSVANAAYLGATFSSSVPASGAAVLTKPAWLTVMADDVKPITSVSMTVNGKPALTQLTYPVGHWTWDDEAETDVWVVDDATVAKIWAYNRDWTMLSGANTVVVTINSGVVPSSHSWTFDYVTGTTVGTHAPAANSILPASPAAISATLVSPSTSFSATMTVDGTVVPLAYTVGSKTFTHTPTEAYAPGFHTVVFIARDTRVGYATKSWSFKVSPPMSTGYDCASCHPRYTTSHPVTGCSGCHTKAYAPAGRHGDEIPTVNGCMGDGVNNGFAECHQFDHSGEAGRGTTPFTCAECHSANNPTMPRHFNEAELTVALRSSTSGCFGTGCHTKSIITEHAKYPTGSALKYQCDLCHGPNAPQNVKDAILGQNMACTACHSGFHTGIE